MAFGANVGCYVFSLLMLIGLSPGSTQQVGAWRVVTVVALLGIQATWLAWMRKQVIGTMVASLLLWQAAMLVGGREPLMVEPGIMFALFTFATEGAGAIRIILSAGGVLATAATVLGTQALYGAAALQGRPGNAVWTTPVLIVHALVLAAATAGIPILLGMWYGQLRDRSERIAELAHHITDGETARTTEAIAAERRTIAQEIHDTSSAHLAALLALVIAVQATSMLPVQAKLIAQIRDEGERLYDALQRVVTGMHQEDRTVPSHYHGERQADQRSITEIGALVAEHRQAAHVPVALDIDTELPVIDGHLGGTRSHIAFRVIQEALNNARKHASGAAVTVTISDDGSSSVLLRVENAGGGSAINGPGTARRRPNLGYGLPGMRDRLVAAGGSLRTGPMHNGGWSVNALLPYPARGQRTQPTKAKLPSNQALIAHAGAPPPGSAEAEVPGKKGVFA